MQKYTLTWAFPCVATRCLCHHDNWIPVRSETTILNSCDCHKQTLFDAKLHRCCVTCVQINPTQIIWAFFVLFFFFAHVYTYYKMHRTRLPWVVNNIKMISINVKLFQKILMSPCWRNKHFQNNHVNNEKWQTWRVLLHVP